MEFDEKNRGKSPASAPDAVGPDVRNRGSTPPVALSTLKAGEKGTIMSIAADGEFGRRLIEMGLVHGSVVKVERIAPLGDPMDIKVKGYHLSLRKDEARQIEVERLQP